MSQPSFGGDGHQTEQELRRWAADVEAKAQRYHRMQNEVAQVSVVESDRDEVVRVTVDATGAVTDLVISDRCYELSGGAELAALVLTTMRRAQSRITERVSEVMARTVGDDAQTVAAVVGSYRERFPEPDPEPVRGVEELSLGDVPEDPPPAQSATRPKRADDEDDWTGPSILT
ncbi:YbaB/EbfC family nucleoid-associated protein [Actinokineospora sp.]|uniref:YbaB/EbfC family nucleoid-associated protein n=1 Tax=Actinokineospora sp. TaxID=1872133 RepID=UPI00403820F9